MFIGDQAEETACNINSVVLENGGSFQYLERDIANSNNDAKTVEKAKIGMLTTKSKQY